MGSLQDSSRLRVGSICIIGAGPSGLAAAKYLLAEQAFSRIVIFEQRSNTGGLWNYCSNDSLDEISVPQTSPHAGLEKPIWRSRDGGDVQNGESCSPSFMSPIYDRLETNIPRGLMGFSDLDWSDDCQLFPTHETTLEYIERYAEDVRDLVQFRTPVVDITLTKNERWLVKTRWFSSHQSSEIRNDAFDAVLVANGHFSVPTIPSVLGIEAWNKAYPGSVIHSKYYRKPEIYTGKKVIVVGNGPSGIDIAAQIVTACKAPLLLSSRSDPYLQLDDPSMVHKAEIAEYLVEDRTVRFKDGSTETDVDVIVYCTGYFYSFPFLNSLEPPIVTRGEYVENTYQHIFYRPHPTLAFATLNQKIIPFPIAEAQSAVIARVWSGRLILPSEIEMKDWERETLKETGGGRNFHVLKFPKDAGYINMLHDWAVVAEGESNITNASQKSSRSQVDEVNGDHGAIGKKPPYWGEKECWTRERFPAIKKAFQSFGEDRHFKRTLTDVGFDFEAWKRA